MNNINEYLSAKIKNLKQFPKTPNKASIISFLKYKGAKELKNPDLNDYDFILKSFTTNYLDKPRFMTGTYNPNQENEQWIRICNAGKVNDENPIIYISVTDDGSEKLVHAAFYDNIIGFEDFNSHGEEKPIHSYEDMLDEINKYFGW